VLFGFLLSAAFLFAPISEPTSHSHCSTTRFSAKILSPLFTTLTASHRCAPPLPPMTGRPDKSAVQLAPESSHTVPYG